MVTKVQIEVIAKEKEVLDEEKEISKVILEAQSKIDKGKNQEFSPKEVKESLLEQ